MRGTRSRRRLLLLAFAAAVVFEYERIVAVLILRNSWGSSLSWCRGGGDRGVDGLRQLRGRGWHEVLLLLWWRFEIAVLLLSLLNQSLAACLVRSSCSGSVVFGHRSALHVQKRNGSVAASASRCQVLALACTSPGGIF